MSDTLHAVQPDSRGRVALRALVDTSRTYTASRSPDGTVMLTPIAHVMSEEAYADLQADPIGYANLLARSRAIIQGSPTISIAEFWEQVDVGDDAVE
jgi:hypothetical protein